MKHALIILSMTLAFCNGCSTTEQQGSSQYITSQHYAKVMSATPTGYNAKIMQGALAGSLVGIMENIDGSSKEMVSGAIIGAFIGSLFTSIKQTINNEHTESIRYQLASQHEQYDIVLEDELYAVGECVLVTQTQEVDLKSVDDHFCQSLTP